MFELFIVKEVEMPAAIAATAKRRAVAIKIEDRRNARGTFDLHVHESFNPSAMSAVGEGRVRSKA